MKVTKGDIIINFYDDLLNDLTVEQKRELVESLVWDDDIFTDIVSSLVSGVGTPNYNSHIHKARLEFLDKMPEAAQSLVATLQHEIDRARDEEKRMTEWAWKLWKVLQECDHHGSGRTHMPAIPDFVSTAWITKEQAQKMIDDGTSTEQCG